MRRRPTIHDPSRGLGAALGTVLFLALAGVPASVRADQDGNSDPVAAPVEDTRDPAASDFEMPTPEEQLLQRQANEIVVEARVAYEIADGIYVDVGVKSKLRTGMLGWLEYRGKRIARIEVGQIATGSSFIRVITDPSVEIPNAGERVRLMLEAPLAPLEPETVISETIRETDEPEVPFEPLLGPYLVDAETKNIFHGSLGIRQYGQATSNEFEDYSRTHLDTAGTIERLGGTPWALEWSMDLVYRAGEAFEDQNHFEEVSPELYRLSLTRRYDDRSITRVGRFLPESLPTVGYLDGFQAEILLGPFLRMGGLVGFKPKRDDLAVSGKEPMMVSYTTFFWNVDNQHRYSATTGALISLYEGKSDRMAFLLDQQAIVGPWTLYSNTEVDFDIGGALVTDGPQLTRLDLSSTYSLGNTLFRGGYNKFSIPDTAAERDALQLLTVQAADFLDDDYSRTYLGATHRLTRSFSVEEQVSYVNSDVTDDQVLWLVGLTQRNWFVSGSSITWRAYNLGGEDIDGYGTTLTASIPLIDGRLSLLPSLSARFVDFDTPNVDLEVSEAALRLYWRAGARWSIVGGVAYTDADDIGRFALDLGVTLRW